MTTTSQTVAAILKKAGITFRPLPKDWGNSHLGQIFHHMIPERICEFDPKCIAEAANYVGVLQAFAQATQGEFVPESLRAEGSVGGKVVLEFMHAGKAIRFKFTQQGRWVADDFYEQLRKFCRKHLSGSYLSVGTDWAMEVYLPHKVIAQIQKKTRTFDSVEAVVQFVVEGASPSDMFTAWESLPWQLKAGYTRDGDSLMTALLKSEADTDRCLSAYETHETPLLPSRYGESPLELAQRLRGVNPRHLIGEPSATLGYAEIRQKWSQRLWHSYRPEYMRIVDALEADLSSMRFSESGNLYGIVMCHAPLLDCGTEVAEVHYHEYNPAYTLNLLTLGPGGGALYLQLPLDQVETVIDLLRRYCRRTLWTTPGQDGAWLVVPK
ncbi:hypothetical protein ACDW_16610 [Acidovorax sp. DW039]|uniref:hypothetical protein n=1 Tax=Acidovorax sp. DW039 TaxID=3095606 RepID=UPI0030881B88|nr:hypothetical protein ACDW_16610 [Acidovorax sp. DW039]